MTTNKVEEVDQLVSTALRRRTIVVHTRLAGHMARVEAARAGEHGTQILTMGQLAARLAGGLLRPIDREELLDAVRASLATVSIGELEPIKDLPGMVRAVAETLQKVWNADIDLGNATNPRLQALAALEQQVLRLLPPSMKRPKDLVAIALERLRCAGSVLGTVEIRGHTEMPPCWRPLLAHLSEVTSVQWTAGPRFVPAWLRDTNVTVDEQAASPPDPALFECANAQHEVVEAFRWVRSLLASGAARPEQIALVAASTSELDDHVFAAARDSNIPVHFVNGVRAVTKRDGQVAAALAEVVLKGLSQQRVRRLFALLRNDPVLRDLAPDWARVLPIDAPLANLERWEKALSRTQPADWPDGRDQSALVLGVLRCVSRGPTAAAEIGHELLQGIPLRLWTRALREGPAAALSVTLSRMRLDDDVEPAANVLWAPSSVLASAPRPYVRLLALNAGRWPRGISEDRLIPDHVVPAAELDPLPIADADRRDYATILAFAESATISFSRRGADGRRLGASSLVPKGAKPVHLARARTPEHAASESDRLLARPSEFRTMPAAISAEACWRDWFRAEVTAHDGLIGRPHPRLDKVFGAPLSATSLRMLLRDPLRFVWRYALGWKQPEESDEPLTLDALSFGTFVHEGLERTVASLEEAGGFSLATAGELQRAIDVASEQTRASWELDKPVPPALIWQRTVERARRMMQTALTEPLAALPNQKSWTEVPFGGMDPADAGDGIAPAATADVPWAHDSVVRIPGTKVAIRGQIDRLDLSGDGRVARVIDYKTGKLSKKMSDISIDKGRELQRCLYAFAVRTLVPQATTIEAGLLFPIASADEDKWYPLADLEGMLELLSLAIRRSHEAVTSGIAPPGIGAADEHNDHKFALPASATYLNRKAVPAAALLGEAAAVWSHE